MVLASLALALASIVALQPAPKREPVRQSIQLKNDKDKERVKYLQDLMRYGSDNVDSYSVVAGWCNVLGMNAAQLAERRSDAIFGLR